MQKSKYCMIPLPVNQEVQKQAKLVYGVKSQICGPVEGGIEQEGEREALAKQVMFSTLIWGSLHRCVNSKKIRKTLHS